MFKYILIAFAVMAFAFYELSGGEDFVSIAEEKRALQKIEEEKQRVAEAAAKAEREAQLASSTVETTSAQTTELATALTTTRVITASADAGTAADPVTTAEVQAAVLAALDADTVDGEAESDRVVVAVAEPEPEPKDIRAVTAARVNMRGGPGQNFDVLAKLTSGEQVEILQDPGDGWVKLKVMDTGRVGWMADFLLTAANSN
ncbi:MAG: SH3 domain-containing protein [Pseudomonadota bacterium]